MMDSGCMMMSLMHDYYGRTGAERDAGVMCVDANDGGCRC